MIHFRKQYSTGRGLMELPTLHSATFLLAAAAILLLSCRRLLHRPKSGMRRRLPPSPPAIPIIGHLHLLKPPRHLSMTALFAKYGPIVFLRLGSRPTLIVSSPDLVEEIYATNDATFANRPYLHAGEVLGYNNTSMFVAPYGTHWRNLRRLTAVELLSTGRLNMLAAARTEELLCMARRMLQGGDVELKGRLTELTYNVLTQMVAGKRYYGADVTEGEAEAAARFRENLNELVALIFAFNPRDFFPWLGWADLMGVERRMWRLRNKIRDFTKGLVEGHRRKRSEKAEERRRTLIDVMLSMQESDPETYTDDLIEGQIMTILTAGSDTIVETTESTMRILLSHPEIMKKARAEIDANVPGGQVLEEADLARLPYLQCILKELMRLSPIMQGHPPHASSEDCTINGYHVPRGTMVFVDVWGIQRDPKLWDDPLAFKPERFANHSGWRDGFKYFPFGLGRRACPGENLGAQMVTYVVGFFIQCFDWDPMTPEEVDLSGLLGLSTPVSKPLVARYKIRDSMTNALTKI